MYRVDITNNGGYRFNVKSKDYDFTIDTAGSAVTPPDTLLASLGSCIGVYIRKFAEGSGLALDEFSITVEAELSKEAPVCFRKINAFVDLKGFEMDERRKNALTHFIKNCPVHNTLKIGPDVNIDIKQR